MKTFGRALTAATFSLGIAWLAAGSIRGSDASGPGLPRPSVTPTPEVVAAGRERFLLSCSECHGDDARGEDGPDLHLLPISNAHIAVVITRGIKGEMPSFAKKYDRAQIASIVAYLRSLQ